MKLRRSRLLSLVREGQLVTVFKANLNDPRILEIGLEHGEIGRAHV